MIDIPLLLTPALRVSKTNIEKFAKVKILCPSCGKYKRVMPDAIQCDDCESEHREIHHLQGEDFGWRK